jgi:hypothetical protein
MRFNHSFLRQRNELKELIEKMAIANDLLTLFEGVDNDLIIHK